MKNIIIFILVLFSTILYAQQDTLVRKLVDTKIMADTLAKYWDSTKTAPIASPTFTGTVKANIIIGQTIALGDTVYSGIITISDGVTDEGVQITGGNNTDFKIGGKQVATQENVSDSLGRYWDSTEVKAYVPPYATNAETIFDSRLGLYKAGDQYINQTTTQQQYIASDLSVTGVIGALSGISGVTYAEFTGEFLHKAVSIDTVASRAYVKTSLGRYWDSTEVQTKLNLKAPIASPTFTGTATAPDFIASTGDIKAGTIGRGLILRSPDGSSFRVTVGNDSVLTTTKLPD